MSRDLDYLNQTCVRVLSGGLESGGLHPFKVGVVELVTVTMSLGNHLAAVNPISQRVLVKLAVVGSKPHRSALNRGALLLLHQVYDRIGSVRVDLGRNRILDSKHIPGELNHAHLHSQTYSEERHVVLAGVFYCKNLAFQSPLAESRCDENSVHIPDLFLKVGTVKMLALNSVDIHLALVGGSGVDKGFQN